MKIDNEFLHWDLETLQRIFDGGQARLKAALLEGKPWNEVQGMRHQLTDIENALHIKLRSVAKEGRTNDPGSFILDIE